MEAARYFLQREERTLLGSEAALSVGAPLLEDLAERQQLGDNERTMALLLASDLRLQRLEVDRARELLELARESSDPSLLPEVAYRLGFSNPAHFSTRFRSFYRVPPSRMIRPTSDADASSAADDDAGLVN